MQAISRELNPMVEHESDESEFRKIDEIQSQDDSDLLSIDGRPENVKNIDISAITVQQRKNPLLDSQDFENRHAYHKNQTDHNNEDDCQVVAPVCYNSQIKLVKE